MRPNQAWLNREGKGDATTQGGTNSDMHKSRMSFLFPNINDIRRLANKKNEKGPTAQMLDAMNESNVNSKNVKNISKIFTINREDPLIQELFKKMCQEKRDSNLQRAKMTKGKMKAYLSKKYKGKVAEKILAVLDLSISQDFNAYCDMLERLLNITPDKLKRMTFNVYNFNEDRTICDLDLYAIMKLYENDDEVFVEAYSYDICILSAVLDKKKVEKGHKNHDLDQKMKRIERILAVSGHGYKSRKIGDKSTVG